MFDLLFFLLLPPLTSYLRIPARKRQLPDKAWSKALCSLGGATTNPYSNCLETLQIQPSKVRSRVFCSWSFKTLKPCNTDEAGRPLFANECLQCHVDGEHTGAHRLHLNEVAQALLPAL